MDAHHSSLGFELTIIRAKNTEFKSTGNLFVRIYLSAGNNSRIKLSSREISSRSNLFWNEKFSLDCSGTKDSIDMLKQGSIVLELRWRSTAPVVGTLVGSQLLGRAEIPWKTVLHSPDMEIEIWVPMVSKSTRSRGDSKPPALQVGMKLRVPAVVAAEALERMRRRRRLTEGDDQCGCKGCGVCNFADYDVFAMGFALEAS